MTTPIGGSNAPAIIFNCYFVDAVNEGEPVELALTTTLTTIEGLDEDPLVRVQGLTATTKLFGVAKFTVAAGGIGEVIHHGPARVTFGGAVVGGAKIQAQIDGKFDPYAAGTIHGVAMESGVDTDKGWVFLNAIGFDSFGI